MDLDGHALAMLAGLTCIMLISSGCGLLIWASALRDPALSPLLKEAGLR